MLQKKSIRKLRSTRLLFVHATMIFLAETGFIGAYLKGAEVVYVTCRENLTNFALTARTLEGILIFLQDGLLVSLFFAFRTQQDSGSKAV